MTAERPGRGMLGAGRHTVALRHRERDRPYLLHVPPGFAADGLALVLQLHGRGIDPTRFDAWTGFTAVADEVRFVVAMPSAIGEIWNDGRFPGRPADAIDDVGYLSSVLDDAGDRLPFDPTRVYVVGMSNGATMAGRLACERAERLAGVAQVAGTAALTVAVECRPAAQVPILSIHGSADRFAPYAGGRARGPVARLLLRLAAAPSVGVDDWARRWVTANGAGDGPIEERLGSDTTVRRWHGRSPGSDVVFYRIEGGGHTWPGSRSPVPPFLGRRSGTFDATRTIWEFFAGHRRER